MRKIKKCNYCGSTEVKPEHFNNVYYVMCLNCKNSTTDCKDFKTALKEWDKINR